MRTLCAWGILAALALPARADIVDSGSLQIGGQGIIGGTMTVQGNALAVAGAVSATSATLSGSGAQVYSLTTSSGIHIVGGKLKLDSGAMIQWPDGSTSTSAVSPVAGNVSSATLIQSDFVSGTHGTNSVCITGSTVTITASGKPVLLSLQANKILPNGNNFGFIGILRDGGYFAGQTSALGLQQTPINSVELPGVSLLDTYTGTGTRSYCITLWASAPAYSTLYAPINFSAIEFH